MSRTAIIGDLFDISRGYRELATVTNFDSIKGEQK